MEAWDDMFNVDKSGFGALIEDQTGEFIAKKTFAERVGVMQRHVDVNVSFDSNSFILG